MRFALGVLLCLPMAGVTQAGSVSSTPRFFSIAAVLNQNPGGSAKLDQSAPFKTRGFALFRIETHSAASKWASIEPRIERDIAAIANCSSAPRECTSHAHRAHAIISQASHLPDLEKARFITTQVNSAVGYQSDVAHHGAQDVWSSPLETLGKRGDCEDYAIAKYALLKASGIDEEALRIVVVYDGLAGEDHAVVSIRVGNEWKLLDNRHNRVEADNELRHYRPLMSLSKDKTELYAAPLYPSAFTG